MVEEKEFALTTSTAGLGVCRQSEYVHISTHCPSHARRLKQQVSLFLNFMLKLKRSTQ
jgi:hypothetical protein